MTIKTNSLVINGKSAAKTRIRCCCWWMENMKRIIKIEKQPFLAWFHFLLWSVSVVLVLSLCGCSRYYKHVGGESLLVWGLPWVSLPRQQGPINDNLPPVNRRYGPYIVTASVWNYPFLSNTRWDWSTVTKTNIETDTPNAVFGHLPFLGRQMNTWLLCPQSPQLPKW